MRGGFIDAIGELLRWWVLLIFRALIFIFFNDVEVIGRENIPKTGAVIFVGNHHNQFVDVLVMLSHCSRTPAFIIAAVSLRRKVIAFFAYLLRCIPVVRPRDIAQVATGTVSSDGTVIRGEGTCFTKEVSEGDEILAHSRPQLRLRVTSVVSDTEFHVAEQPDPPLPSGFVIKVYKKVDQGNVFYQVWDELGHGNSIGIFPEGSSHDRPNMLPFQPGVALMALGTVANKNVPVKIVPCGLTYFSGHRFRGHVIVEYGRPITVLPEDDYNAMYKDTKTRRKATGLLLQDIKEALEKVTLNLPTYEALQTVYLARELFQPDGVSISSVTFQALNRRIAQFWEAYKERDDVKDLAHDIAKYKHALKYYGIRDYQVASGTHRLSTGEFAWLTMKRLLTFAVVMILSSPGAIINLPAGAVARLYARFMAKKGAPSDPNSMYGSLDVVASYKIIVAGFGVPMLNVFYCMLAWYYYGFKYGLLLLAYLPILGYASVRLLERGLGELKLLKVMFTLKASRTALHNLENMRDRLRTRIRVMATELGPELGEDFWDKRLVTEMKEGFAKESTANQDGRRPKLRWRHKQYKKMSEEANKLTLSTGDLGQ